MSQVVRHRWSSDLAAPSREARRSCEYEAYVPDLLVGRKIVLDGEVAAEVSEAEAAIAKLNAEAAALVDTEALARILLRVESVASSRIEGLEIGARRLLRAEAARELGEERLDVTAAEALGNIDAMVAGVQTITKGRPITVELLLDMHRRLLAGSRLAEHGGQLRDVQNWIGGSDYNPCSAVFVPPPPERVKSLMHDLMAFCNEDSLPTVAQAALAHAQFETIHPFVDGNGRIGRALIQLVFRGRGLTRRVMPPVSLVLATWAKDYVGGLTATGIEGRRRPEQPTMVSTCGLGASRPRAHGLSPTRRHSSGTPTGSRPSGVGGSVASGLGRRRNCCCTLWWGRRSSRSTARPN